MLFQIADDCIVHVFYSTMPIIKQFAHSQEGSKEKLADTGFVIVNFNAHYNFQKQAF